MKLISALALLLMVSVSHAQGEADAQAQCFEIIKGKILRYEFLPKEVGNQELNARIKQLHTLVPQFLKSVRPGDVRYTWTVPKEADYPIEMGVEAGVSEGNRFKGLSVSLAQAQSAESFLLVQFTYLDFDGDSRKREFEQVLDVDSGCRETVVETELTEWSITAGQLTISQQNFSGDQGVPGAVTSKTVSVPKNGNFRLFISEPSTLAELKAVVRKNPKYTLPGTPERPLHAVKLKETAREYYDPIVERKVRFEGATIGIDLKGTEVEFQGLYSSASEFRISLARNTDEWTLPFSFWNRGKIVQMAEGRIPKSRAKYFASGLRPERISLETDRVLEFANMGAYWEVESLQAADQDKFIYTLKAKPKIDFTHPYTSRSRGMSVPMASEFLKESDLVKFNFPDGQALLNQVVSQLKSSRSTATEKASALIRTLFKNFSYDLRRLTVKGEIEEIPTPQLVKLKSGTCGNFSNLFAAIMRGLRTPTRLVYGYYLMPDHMEAHAWNEYQAEDGQWIPIDPQNIMQEFDPSFYVPLAVMENDTYSDDSNTAQVSSMRTSLELKVLTTRPAN